MTENVVTTSSFALQVFSCSRFGDIRIVMRDNEPWFVAKDVAACIDHSNATKMCDLCRDKDKIVMDVEELKTNDLLVLGNRGLTCISESGLYRILAKCNLPKCEPFENWVFDEVLPSIRKNGAYLSPDAMQSVMMQVTDTVLKIVSNQLVSQITDAVLQTVSNQIVDKTIDAVLQNMRDPMVPVVADCVLQKVGDKVIDAIGKGIERKFSRGVLKTLDDMNDKFQMLKDNLSCLSEHCSTYRTARDVCDEIRLDAEDRELKFAVSSLLLHICECSPEREQMHRGYNSIRVFPAWAVEEFKHRYFANPSIIDPYMDNVHPSPYFQNNSFASVAQRCREQMEAEAEKENDDVSGFFRTQDTPMKQEKKQVCKQSKKVLPPTPTGFF